LAIRGWLKPRELPLWSLKPPYYPETTLVSVGEENNRDNRDTDESIEEEEKGVEDNIGDCVTDEEEDGAVTVLKLSNGVMFRVPSLRRVPQFPIYP
jgi:hypothetical protein